MILSECSKFLRKHESDIANGKPAIGFLTEWVKNILEHPPKNNVQRVLHAEIALCENNCEDFLLVAKSESGRVLMHALFEYAKSFEREVMRKWLKDKSASDFNLNNKK